MGIGETNGTQEHYQLYALACTSRNSRSRQRSSHSVSFLVDVASSVPSPPNYYRSKHRSLPALVAESSPTGTPIISKMFHINAVLMAWPYLLFLHIGANEVDDVRSDAHRKDSDRNRECLLIITDFLCVCYFLTKAEYMPFRAENFGLIRGICCSQDRGKEEVGMVRWLVLSTWKLGTISLSQCLAML